MALHTELPIYKVAYDLLDAITDLAKNMPRDFKQSIGGKLRDECVEIVTLIFRANCARDKATHLESLIERLQVAELLLRLSRDKAWLPDHLGLRLNPTKTILQPVDRGVDFVGQVIRPWHRTSRKRTVNEALRRVIEIDSEDLFETANSYYSLLRQTKSHHQRAKLSNILRYRGYAISGNLTKTYRRAT
jgi:hypothetical protein